MTATLPVTPRSATGPTRRTCVVCSRGITGRGLRYCSARCNAKRATERAGARIIDLYALATRFDLGGKRWRKLLVGYLRERDGDCCQLCRGGILFHLPSGPRGDDLGASVDHVVPRSEGGSDDMANLRLAHWGCNRKRSNRGGNEQLLLFG